MSAFHEPAAFTSRTMVAAAIGMTIGVGSAAALAHHGNDGQVKVVQRSQQDIVEKVNGKDSAATVLEVTLGPGVADTPHRHAGGAFGYVLEGQYEHAINDEPVKTYQAGETFYEPTGCLHRVARNKSAKAPVRLLVVLVHPRDAKELTVWEKAKN